MIEDERTGPSAAVNEEKNAPGLDEMREQLGAVRSELSNLVRLVGAQASAALEGAEGKATSAKEKAVDRAQEAEDELARWIRAQPFRSSLIAMGVGALLWSLLRRS